MTIEKWEMFCHKLGQTENIYDLLVLLYLQIEGRNKPRYIREYYEQQNMVEDGYWGDLSLITNELLTNHIEFGYYVKKFRECVNPENLHNVAFRMLIDFDTYFRDRTKYPALNLERVNFSGNIYHLGPLNKADSEYSIYLMPDCHYFKTINHENNLGIRFMDKSEFTKIDNRIEHYKIVKKDRLDKQVKIKYYGGTGSIEESYPELKIGIVPVAKELWCKVIEVEYERSGGYYFRLEDIEEYSEERNDAYVRILQKCMENNIQIVVFPELARNKKTVKHIQQFLIEKTLEKKNSLELIFMGSLWENGKNEGILISGTGTILMKSQKMNKFFMKRNGKKYWEDLKEEVQEMELIDIPKLGRIQYLICKDGLDNGSQHYLWGLFEIAISFISSYSDSVSHFGKLGESFSAEYGGIHVLANACAPRIGLDKKIKAEVAKMEETNTAKETKTGDSTVGNAEETDLEETENLQEEIGHLIVPCGECGRTGASQKGIYTTLAHCKEQCKFCGCIRVFHINPLLIKESGGKFGNYMEVNPITL